MDNAEAFLEELIHYIFVVCKDDDYITPEGICRKLYKYGFIDKKDGEWIADTPQTERRIDRDGDIWEWRGDAWYCIGQADTPQTDIHGLTDCDFCKGENCEDCEGGKDEPQTD